MKSLVLSLELVAPLIIGQSWQRGNTIYTSSYIPGSALRGAAVEQYLAATGTHELDLDNSEVRRLFFDERVRFLNAYPADPSLETVRLLPCPLSWVTSGTSARSPTAQVHDLAVEEIMLGSSRSLREAFFWKVGDQVSLYSPAFEYHTHHSSSGGQQAQTTSVYNYVAISPGEKFIGAILAEDESDMALIDGLLGNRLLALGRARTAGYGRILVGSTTNFSWQEFEEDRIDSEYTMITLLSDCILRTSDGQTSVELDQTLKELGVLKADHSHLRAFQRPTRVGGYNQKWRLPIPEQWALRAGSTFVYCSDALNAQPLQMLIEKGIGERRIDGYGRIGINLNAQPSVFVIYESKPSSIIPTFALSETSTAMAQVMATRLLHRQLDRALRLGSERIRLLAPLPSRRQLAHLSLVVRQSEWQGDLKLVSEYIQCLDEVAMQELQFCLVNLRPRISLLDWIENLVNQRNVLFWLGFSEAEFPQIGGVYPVVDDHLLGKYTSLLLGAVLDQALTMTGKDG